VLAAWVLGVVGLDLGELLDRAAERSSGVTITASASFAHDVYANVLRGSVSPRSEVRWRG
jgi:hypothetical protein